MINDDLDLDEDFYFEIHGNIYDIRDELLMTIDKDEYEKKLDWICSRYPLEDGKLYIPLSLENLLTDTFMERHLNELDFSKLFVSQNMSEEFVERNFKLLESQPLFQWVFARNSFSEEFLDKHSEDFRFSFYWEQIARWQKISPNFIRKYRDKIDPLCVSHTDPEDDYSPNEGIIYECNLLPTYSTQKPYYTYDEVSALIKEEGLWQKICLQTKDFVNLIKESSVNMKEILNMLDRLKQASKDICSSQEHTAKQR